MGFWREKEKGKGKSGEGGEEGNRAGATSLEVEWEERESRLGGGDPLVSEVVGGELGQGTQVTD